MVVSHDDVVVPEVGHHLHGGLERPDHRNVNQLARNPYPRIIAAADNNRVETGLFRAHDLF